MLHAVQAPLLKMIAVAAVGIAAAAGYGLTKSGPITQHLQLHAQVKPSWVILSAFDEHKQVTVTLDDARPHKITFKIRATLKDSCEWEATETLIPETSSTYSYSYDEEMLSCAPGAEPMYVPTPHTGFVTVED